MESEGAMKIIVFANYKGGVGKSVMSTNFAAAVARKDRAVLHIDMDQQGNSSLALGVSAEEKGVADFLRGDGHLATFIKRHYDTASEGLQIPTLYMIGPGVKLDEIADDFGRRFETDWSTPSEKMREVAKLFADELERMNFAAEQAGEPLDFVVIDTRPDNNWATILALAVADHVVIPVEVDEFSSTGSLKLLGEIVRVKKHLNPKLDLLGTFINKSEKRGRNWKENLEAIRGLYKGRLFRTEVRKTVALKEAVSSRTPAVHSMPDSDGASDIRKLTKEILGRLGMEVE
jgi:chromosome partitioning protein